MSDELVFYTNPQSRGVMTHWMLEEIGCSYRVEVMDYGPKMKSPEYLALNPMGKVPTLKHGSAWWLSFSEITWTALSVCWWS